MSTTDTIGPQTPQIEAVFATSQHLAPGDLQLLIQVGMQMQEEDAVGAFGRAVAALEAAGHEEILGDVSDTMQVIHEILAEELLPEWFSP
ncbi:hypothetical protein [Kocuria sp. SM24M-10]|uniref:hypothetical protein n=1 Tax=Kocuria sp. SM24M-10 TaxID=1660349 RepID=UPI00064961B4|nr:hypothetical protein [Kocuria sp. SM24M-10]KLU11206.1 hypothetical protein ABL57_02615 [Kocuria sp. SM24M-10]